MKEAKGGGRNIHTGGNRRKRKKKVESYRRLGPAAASGLSGWSKTLLQTPGLSGSDLLPLRDGSQKDHEEQ